MSDQLPFGAFDASEFAENPEPRVPCVLLLDTSKSMNGRSLDELNSALITFKETLAADVLAGKRAEIAIITFGGAVELKQDFVTAEQFTPPTLDARGVTPMAEAIRRAIDLLIDRKQVYKQNGISYYRPWIFLITDGAPSDDWKDAARQVHEGESEKGFVFFSVGVEGARMDILREISVREPLKLRGVKFRELFLWLSQSMQSVSHSTPGEKLAIPSPAGWAEI